MAVPGPVGGGGHRGEKVQLAEGRRELGACPVQKRKKKKGQSKVQSKINPVLVRIDSSADRPSLTKMAQSASIEEEGMKKGLGVQRPQQPVARKGRQAPPGCKQITGKTLDEDIGEAVSEALS